MADVDKERMAEYSDHWLWVVDEQYVHTPIGADTLEPDDKKRGIELPALARAVALNAEGKTAKAVKEVDSAVQAGLNLPELHWTKGQLEFELEHYEASLKAYEQVMQLRPKDKAVIFNIGLCLEKLGRVKDAAARYRELTALAPELWVARLGLGGCLLKLGDAAGALKQFDGCLDRSPEHDRAGARPGDDGQSRCSAPAGKVRRVARTLSYGPSYPSQRPGPVGKSGGCRRGLQRRASSA